MSTSFLSVYKFTRSPYYYLAISVLLFLMLLYSFNSIYVVTTNYAIRLRTIYNAFHPYFLDRNTVYPIYDFVFEITPFNGTLGDYWKIANDVLAAFGNNYRAVEPTCIIFKAKGIVNNTVAYIYFIYWYDFYTFSDIYVLNTYKYTVSNNSSLYVKLFTIDKNNPYLIIKINRTKLKTADPKLLSFLGRSIGYITSDKIDLLIPINYLPQSAIKFLNEIFVYKVYLLYYSIKPLDYTDYTSYYRNLCTTIQEILEKKGLNADTKIIPINDHKLLMIDYDYKYIIVNLIISQYILLTIILFVLLKLESKIIAPIYVKEKVLLTSIGFNNEILKRQILLPTTILAIISNIYIYSRFLDLMNSPLFLHNIKSVYLRYFVAFYFILSTLYIYAKFKIVSNGYLLFNIKRKIQYIVLFGMLLILLYLYWELLIKNYSLVTLTILALITLLVSYLIVDAIPRFLKLRHLFVDLTALALLASILLSIIAFPVLETYSIINYENAIVESYLPSDIDRIVLISNHNISTFLPLSNISKYFILNGYVDKIGKIPFIQKIPLASSMNSESGLSYIIKWKRTYIVVLDAKISKKLGFRKGEIKLYMPTSYKFKSSLSEKLLKYNDKYVNISIAVGDVPLNYNCIVIQHVKFRIINKPFPYWIYLDRSPEYVSPLLFEKISHPLEPILAIPYDLSIDLFPRNVTGTLGLINPPSFIIQKLISSESKVTIIDYDKARKELLSELQSAHYSSYGPFFIYMIILTLILGFIYLYDQIKTYDLNLKLFRSIGLTRKEVRIAGMAGISLIISVVAMLESIIVYWLTLNTLMLILSLIISLAFLAMFILIQLYLRVYYH